MYDFDKLNIEDVDMEDLERDVWIWHHILNSPTSSPEDKNKAQNKLRAFLDWIEDKIEVI